MDCDNLTSITIPESVTSISDDAFRNCISLTSANIPSGITTINRHTFYNCRSLLSITIPEGVTSIGSNAFESCHSLTNITIPASVSSIGDYAFYDCKSLSDVTICNAAVYKGYYVFYGTPWGDAKPEKGLWCDVDNVVRGYVGEMPENYSIVIPDGMTEIAYQAFMNQTNLVSVTIPESVIYIANGAFKNCSNLSRIYCKATAPPEMGLNVFYLIAENAIIYVPRASVDAYKSAWSEYADIIQPYDF